MSSEVFRDNMLTETIEFLKIRKLNSTPKNRLILDTNKTCKCDDISILNKLSSHSIIITEADFSPVNKRNRSFILQNSVENKNMDFSFRSFDNMKKFQNEKSENNYSNSFCVSLLQENPPKSSSDLKMLELIKTKTKNLLEMYRNRVENFKFIN